MSHVRHGPLDNLPVHVIRFGAVFEYQAEVLLHSDLRLPYHLLCLGLRQKTT